MDNEKLNSNSVNLLSEEIKRMAKEILSAMENDTRIYWACMDLEEPKKQHAGEVVTVSKIETVSEKNASGTVSDRRLEAYKRAHEI